jgi:hypothetical protein
MPVSDPADFAQWEKITTLLHLQHTALLVVLGLVLYLLYEALG